MLALELAAVAGCVGTIADYTLGELVVMERAVRRHHWDLVAEPWACWLNSNATDGRTYSPWELNPIRKAEYVEPEYGIEVLKGMLFDANG